jgi:uncharacterized integral membrane protein (TIGR00697 family)
MEKSQKRVGSEQRKYRYLDLVMAVFVTVLIVSNIASSAKIIDLGISLFNILPLTFDAGTILFPISYIFGDVLTEVYGYKSSRRVIWAGFFCLALSAAVFWLVRNLPGDVSRQVAYDNILGGMSTGGIVIASLVAYFAGEFSNSFILAKMKILTKGKWLWSRTIGSTLVGEAVDSFVFILVATLARVEGFTWESFLSLAVTIYILKVLIEVLFTPVTYWVVRKLKRLENEDYYDYTTNFNPFEITKG